MAQADGKNKLSRFMLHIPGFGYYRFKVNPENYKYSMPQRTTITKTKGDIVVEDYGRDVETITFSGTTGFKGTKSGKAKLDELYNAINKYAQTAGNGTRPANFITFYNMTDNKSYKVHLAPEGFSYSRSVNEPLLFRYEISLVVLGRASEPPRDSLAETELGNKKPSVGSTYKRQPTATRQTAIDPRTSTTGMGNAVNRIAQFNGQNTGGTR